IEAGIAKVVVACTDPNPLVAGKGIAALREAGIEVVEGVLREPCERLNVVYFHYQRTGRPYVVMKYAMGADGSIGPRAGERYRLTGPAAVHRVHEDRQRYSALMVGVQTVVVDDPLLTCRLGGERTRNPLRIIADTHARIPLDSRIVRSAEEVPTLIACCDCDDEKRRGLTEAGCEIVEVPSTTNGIDLDALLERLAEREIDSVYVEGGARLHGSFAAAHLVDHVEAFVAPQIIGCGDRGPVSCSDVPTNDPLHLANLHIQQLGDDVLLEYDVA
ncbi:MAG: bifunctional diaminohydroxyphosphoribosylaminopyrimidine deaminase/5-amino-6-(5-phosphoribosylamino)uracil reductase RibD, partial [Coriobacteriaceae bacterium]|nr:bifunctional diaminohydroxyphosphoribosylaminopyrimidine deaminase/5-amino-6-(5-phosphoribosylamino)uracil reductase RibD [Coriobacteriaceae bacterium]